MKCPYAEGMESVGMLPKNQHVERACPELQTPFPQGEGISPAMAGDANRSNLVGPAARQGCGFPVHSRQLCTTRWKPLAQHSSPDTALKIQC